MTFEASFPTFSLEAELLDLPTEEGASLSINLASLANNQVRLFTDCDNNDFKGNVIKDHNFDFLVKQSPFQQTSHMTPPRLDSTSEGRSKASDFSTSSFSKKSHLTPLEMPSSPKETEAEGQNKRVFILSEYNPKQKTFPKGILKAGEQRKFADKISDNSLMMRRQLSLGITRKVSNFERDVMTTAGNEYDEEEDFRSNMRKGILILKRKKVETEIETEDVQAQKKKQGMLDKVKKLLAIRKNYSK